MAGERWTRGKKVAVAAAVIMVIGIAVVYMAIDQSLNAVTGLFGRTRDVAQEIEAATRQPLDDRSAVFWDGDAIARLHWFRSAGTAGAGLIDTLEVYQGELLPGAPTDVLQGMAARLISREGDPLLVRVELADSLQFRGLEPIGQLWVDSLVLWVYRERAEGPGAIESQVGGS